MGVQIRNAYAGQPAASNTTLGTANSNAKWAKVDKLVVTNDTTTSITFTTHIVPSGQAVGDEYMVGYNTYSLGSRESLELTKVQAAKLDAGDFVNIIPSLANQLSVHMGILEYFGD